MRYLLRVSVAMAGLATAALTGCSDGTDESSGAVPSSSASPSVAQSASPSGRTTAAEAADRTRAVLVDATRFQPDAPGPAGLMLIEAWPNGNAAYAWETGDHRLCFASVADDRVRERACATHPNDPPVAKGRKISDVFTSFTNGWGRVFAADHQEVASASCDGTPVEVVRIGTMANGVRTLYAVWFSDYTKGEIRLTLRHGTTTSPATFRLGDAGDLSCTAAPARTASTRS